MTDTRVDVTGADPMECRRCGKPHDPAKCTGHRKTDGDPCGLPPIRGGAVCWKHGGQAPQVRDAANRRLVDRGAVLAVATYGLPITIDPRDALLQEVYRTAGHVAYIADQIQQLKTDDLIWGKTEETDTQATEFPGTNTKRAAVPNVWLQLYDRERKHLVAVCKAAIDAGIEERRVRIVEQMGGQLAAVIRAYNERLGLTVEQLAAAPYALADAVASLTSPTLALEGSSR